MSHTGRNHFHHAHYRSGFPPTVRQGWKMDPSASLTLVRRRAGQQIRYRERRARTTRHRAFVPLPGAIPSRFAPAEAAFGRLHLPEQNQDLLFRISEHVVQYVVQTTLSRTVLRWFTQPYTLRTPPAAPPDVLPHKRKIYVLICLQHSSQKSNSSTTQLQPPLTPPQSLCTSRLTGLGFNHNLMNA